MDKEQEQLTDEQLQELVLEAQAEALRNERKEQTEDKPRRPFPKWIIWLVALSLVIQTLAFLPEKFSIPAVKFLITSTKLSQREDIQTYKKAVAVIATDQSRGTGFAIDQKGTILTNDHVIEGNKTVTIAFPGEGPMHADVIATYPAIDLAVLQARTDKKTPALDIAPRATLNKREHVTFIGNPLRFQGIANEGTVLGTIQLQSWQEEVIMLQAPVYRGNSGSPVLNDEGKVVGIIFATLRHEKHGKVGLFVPIDLFHQYKKGVP